MTKAQFKELGQLLSTEKNIVIVPHKNPDGDAIGSVLACYHYLKKKDHNVQIVSPNSHPQFLAWLPGADTIYRFDYHNIQSKKAINNADLIFLMDFNTLSRVGDDMQKTLEAYQGTFVMIDHHQEPSDVAKYLFSDTSVCATAQMFYYFLEQLGDLSLIDRTIATCIYTGILTDTGSFRFASTTADTHRIVADLIDKGADNSSIYSSIFDQNTYGRMQLLGVALQNLVVLQEYNTAYITISEAEKSAHDFQKGDTEGFVNYALSIKDINFGVIFIEDKEQEIIKISFRSKGNFSVNKFARQHFDGGGHDNAAGGRSKLDMKETVEQFTDLLPQYKNEIINSYES